MKRKTYLCPNIVAIVVIHSQSQLLSGSEQTTGRPSANFMSNPDIGNDDDSQHSVKAHVGVTWE